MKMLSQCVAAGKKTNFTSGIIRKKIENKTANTVISLSMLIWSTVYSSGNHVSKRLFKHWKKCRNLQPKLKHYPYKKRDNLFRLEKKQLRGKSKDIKA